MSCINARHLEFSFELEGFRGRTRHVEFVASVAMGVRLRTALLFLGGRYLGTTEFNVPDYAVTTACVSSAIAAMAVSGLAARALVTAALSPEVVPTCHWF